MVCPSGAARATYSAAMAPLAPALFSTITVRPSSADIFCATTRAMPSLPPPAAVGTTSVMGRSGKAACAPAGKASAPASRARQSARRRAGRCRVDGVGGCGGGGVCCLLHVLIGGGAAGGRPGRGGGGGVGGLGGWGVGGICCLLHVLIGGATAGHRRAMARGIQAPLRFARRTACPRKSCGR